MQLHASTNLSNPTTWTAVTNPVISSMDFIRHDANCRNTILSTAMAVRDLNSNNSQNENSTFALAICFFPPD
ncbi:MAG: hypothetical protein ACR2H1_05595, partial [Limisphaerales bacterium]